MAGETIMKAFYVLFGRENNARSVMVTDYEGTAALSFVSSQANQDISVLLARYPVLECIRTLRTTGVKWSQELEVPRSVATQRLKEWRKTAERQGFKLLTKINVR
jgi:hypothetical protein